jgi:hypothetical protein
VEALSAFCEGGVTVDQSRQANGSPLLKTNVVPEGAYKRDFYDDY